MMGIDQLLEFHTSVRDFGGWGYLCKLKCIAGRLNLRHVWLPLSAKLFWPKIGLILVLTAFKWNFFCQFRWKSLSFKLDLGFFLL